MKKKTRTGGTVNLIYPYNYSVGNVSQVNPPFLDPDGPMQDNNGGLNVKVAAPINKANNHIGLSHDASLEVTKDGFLALNYSTECPIITLDDGIHLRTDTSLRVDEEWELGVNIRPYEPLETTNEGLRLNFDDTLLVSESETVKDTYELGVAINHEGPITADEKGIDLEIDQKTMVVSTGNNPALGVKIKTDGGLASDENGVAVNVDGTTIKIEGGKLVANSSTDKITIDNTLKYTGDTLGVNLQSGGVIVTDSNGVKLLYNNDFKEDQQNGLALKIPITYLSPYVIYESGTFNLSMYNSQVRTSKQNWPCSYHIYAVNSSGIVNMNLQLAIRRSDIISIQGSGNTISFTFIINPGGFQNGDHSLMRYQKYTPDMEVTKQYFVPTIQDSVYKKDLPKLYENWYVIYAQNPGIFVSFMPVNRNLKPTWINGRFKYFVGNVGTSIDTQYVLCLTFECNADNGSWYTDNEALFYSGMLPITYNALQPKYNSIN